MLWLSQETQKQYLENVISVSDKTLQKLGMEGNFFNLK